MYAGHVGVALAARGVRRDLPLWVLVLAAQACDWVELSLRAIGVRATADLYSHAYPPVVVAAAVAAAGVWAWKRSFGAALTVLIVYLSHPLADYITGLKPLWLGGPRVGLVLTQRPAADFLAQALVCLAGYALYQRSLAPTRRRHFSASLPLVILLSLQALSDLVLATRSLRRRPSPTLSSRAEVGSSVFPSGGVLPSGLSFRAVRPAGPRSRGTLTFWIEGPGSLPGRCGFLICPRSGHPRGFAPALGMTAARLRSE